MTPQFRHLAQTVLFGPSAYTAHVELYSKDGKTSKFEVSPSVAIAEIDRHESKVLLNLSKRSRSKLWVNLNDEIGPISLPKGIRTQVRKRIQERIKSNYRSGISNITFRDLQTYIQSLGLPHPTSFLNAGSFLALGLSYDIMTLPEPSYTTIFGLGLFYGSKILTNAITSPCGVHITTDQFRLDITKKKII